VSRTGIDLFTPEKDPPRRDSRSAPRRARVAAAAVAYPLLRLLLLSLRLFILAL